MARHSKIKNYIQKTPTINQYLKETRKVYFIYEGFDFLESPWFSQALNLKFENDKAQSWKSLKKAPFSWSWVVEVEKWGAGKL